MTDAQTEARAMFTGLAVAFGSNAEHEEVMRRIATALAAKDEELEKWAKNALDNDECREMWQRRAERAEAQLAEANKALEPFADDAFIAMCAGHDDDYYPDWSPFVSCGHYRAARRVREQGGENNG